MKISGAFDAFGKHMNWLFRITSPKKHLMYGIGNRTRDGTYLLFLDYDDMPESWVRDEIDLLQRRYPMLVRTAYLFATKRGHHVIFLEKNDLDDVIEMLGITSADKNYKDIPMYYGRRIWVLRSSPKRDENITYKGAIHNPYEWDHPRERSNAHAKYLQDRYNIPFTDLATDGPYDESTELTLAYYRVSDENT